MAIAGILISLIIIVEFVLYALLIPDLSQPPLRVYPLDAYLGRAAYVIAYILSLMRAPLGLLPYLVKLFIFFELNIRYESAQSTYFREVINMAGDFVNLGLSFVLLFWLIGSPALVAPAIILYLPLGAEAMRLLTERVPITFSAWWQLLPHRSIAQKVQARKHDHIIWRWAAQIFARYVHYYGLSDSERGQYVLDVLKQRAFGNIELMKRLEYMQAFRVIPRRHGLRSGNVRDVARGEVFIHESWTNDPWLLIGMVLRRAPWMFDPRYLRRPFYYMTEANVLATLCVLEHARYSLPYAVFQFGHEIRVARLHLFYILLRWLGIDIEHKVNADGTFQFDQFICWLEMRFDHGQSVARQRPLYNDEEVIADILRKKHVGERVRTHRGGAMDVAISYTYPLKYVEEVLLAKIEEANG